MRRGCRQRESKGKIASNIQQERMFYAWYFFPSERVSISLSADEIVVKGTTTLRRHGALGRDGATRDSGAPVYERMGVFILCRF